MSMWFELAAAQAGAISRTQLLDAGVSPSGVDRRLRSGTLRRLHPGVYAVAGSPDTVAQRRWAALLAVGGGAVLSFDSAARIHRLTAVAADGPVVLTVPHSGSQSLAGVVVHQIDDLSPADVVELDGFPVTSIPRTIVDLAATWRRGRLGLLVEDAVAARRTTDAEIGACLRSVARRGKPGVRLLTALLDERGPGKTPAASVLERDFFRLVAPSPLPEPRRQYPLPRTDGVRGLVDSAWPEVKLIAEVDGRRWHQRIADMKRDRDRDLHAAALGWQVVRPLHEHVVGAPEETLRELVAVYEIRRRQLGGAA
ncbi:MAG TPA: type IV toxin-antitoxin system AbiEi family antitoxin domain-containing protein [Acidimicrobiales bacterium]|nr:type IV toxin-antitoxin system AbiEi family antitoxin domain-containing protein [Acidimicrobiales bacterium]